MPTASPLSPYGPTPTGYSCSYCGYWAQYGMEHKCQETFPSQEARIAAALERIAVALEGRS